MPGFFPIALPGEGLSSYSAALLVIVLLVAVKLTYGLSRRNARLLPYPPGPKPKFLIGNALDLPKGGAGRVFAKWGKKYNSDILHATAFGNHIVVINDLKIAKEVFEKRAQLYNDRPVMPIIKLIGWEYNFGLLPYGDVWRHHRKICWQNFNSNAMRKYHPLQHESVHRFLRNVLQEPEKVFEHSKFMSISMAMLMMYGYAPDSLDDPIVHVADEGARLGASLLEPGGTLINILPVLRHVPSWVPGATAKKIAERSKWLAEEMKRLPMERVTAAVKAGNAAPSFVTDFMEKKLTIGATQEEEDAIKSIAWTIYGAGTDTIISATGIFLYLIAKNSHVQRKAQEEIDRVIGNSRLPDINDQPDLPYIEAIFRETMRYEPPLGNGIPHALVDDDVVDGYFLPKGTMIFSNIWAMTHDENMYPDPYTFKPERFFNEDGKLNDDSRILAYGFGRRICVGKEIATDMLWIIMATFLSCFNIGKAKDEFGNEIEFDGSFNEFGVVIHKKPFKCSITPRSEQIGKVIERLG